MRIHKIQVWRFLFQLVECGNWFTAQLLIDWLKNPKRQAEILLRERYYEEQTPYMRTSVYGIRRVYLWRAP